MTALPGAACNIPPLGMRGKYSGLEVTEKSRQPRRSAPYVTTAPTRSARLLFLFSKEANNYDFKFACLLCEYSVRDFRAYSYRKILHCSACGLCKIGMTIEEAADYTGIGRNTLRRLVDWGKIPVLRIGRKSIVRVDVICCFMQINEGRDLLDRNQVLAVK